MTRDDSIVIRRVVNGWEVLPDNPNQGYILFNDVRVFNKFRDLTRFLDMHFTKTDLFPDHKADG